MTLQHQEVQEPETSEVIHLAQQMYERDRAENERRTSLAAAAEEIGIPAEYLAKATAQLKAKQRVSTQQQTKRSPVAMLIAAAIAMFIAIVLSYFLTVVREAPQAPVMESPSPVTRPLDAPPERIAPPPTQPATP
jgi:hypothetical protein